MLSKLKMVFRGEKQFKTSAIVTIFMMIISFIIYNFAFKSQHIKTRGSHVDVLLSDRFHELTYQNRSGIHNAQLRKNNSCFHLSILKQQALKQLAGIKQKEKVLSTCQRFVVLILGRYRGRMGNQMFQVASLIGTAYKHDVIPIIPKAMPLHRYFDLPNTIDLKLNKVANLEKCVCMKTAWYYNCTRGLKSKKNISLHGYLQSWKYFDGATDIIKKVFKFRPRHLLNANIFLSNVTLVDCQRVCIHIRRGMNRKALIADGFVVAGLDFIKKAKKFYENKYLKVQFIVLSDDKAWCKRHLTDVEISTFTNPGDDMALMTLCDHVVVTTGTFGWWGAWLSGGITVYFNQFPKEGSRLAARMNRKDYYPPYYMS